MRRFARPLFTLCSILSLAACVATTAVFVRSFFVSDAVTWSNWTEEPLTPEAAAWAQQRLGPNVAIKFISRGETVSLFAWRGKLLFGRSVQMTPSSRWDEWFKATYVDRPQFNYESRSPEGHGTISGLDMSGFWGRLGFGNFYQPIPGLWSGWYRWVFVPLWAVMLSTAIPPILWTQRRLRVRRRRRRGLCRECGYDLRNSPERCPECGAKRNEMARV